MLLVLLPALAGAAEPAPLPPDSVFRQLILERREAFGRGDAAVYARLVDRDVVHLNDFGVRREREALLAHVAANSGGHARYEVTDLHVRAEGALAIVDCEVVESIPYGPRMVPVRARELNVFAERAGSWQLLAHAETPEFTSPPEVPVEAAVLDDYVGEYEWWPGFREVYTRRGDQLVVRATGDTESTPLKAASGEAFFFPGDASVGVFVRDASGRVTHQLVHIADGRVVISRRVAGAAPSAAPSLPPPGRSLLQHATDVAVRQPAPYDGGGVTTGFPFFENVPDSTIGFRKRVLPPGTAIGYHLHDGSEPGLGDEVYYVLSGRGELTLDGKIQEVGAGTAILTRLGSSHGLRQVGKEDLVVVMAWPERSLETRSRR